jgi:hypothetical protein
MIIRYKNTLQDFTDRRKKLKPHDDGRECIVELMKGAAGIALGLLVFWLFLRAA